MTLFLKKVTKIFGQFKKKQYLCTRFLIKSALSLEKIVFLAQLVEQLTLNQWVEGSSPSEDTKGHPDGCPFLFYCRLSAKASASSIWSILPTSIIL